MELTAMLQPRRPLNRRVYVQLRTYVGTSPMNRCPSRLDWNPSGTFLVGDGPVESRIEGDNCGQRGAKVYMGFRLNKENLV